MNELKTATAEAVIEPLIDLHRLSAGIRWRRRIWVLIGLAGLVLGAALPLLLPSVSATTAVYVVHADTNVTGDAAMKTDLAILGTTSVAADAATRLGIDVPPDKFLGAYSGEVLAGNVLQITASGQDRQQALERAKAVADAFIAQLVKRSDDEVKAEVDAYTRGADEARQELGAVESQLAASPPAAAQQQLIDRQSVLKQQVTDMDQQAEEAKIGYPRLVAGTQIIDAPRVVSRSASVSTVLYGVVGLIAGLGLGMTLAAVATVVGDRPVLRRDIAAHLGASVIAQVPAIPIGPSRLWKRSRAEDQRRETAVTLARTVRAGDGPVSLLELRCAAAAAALVLDVAEELSAERPVLIIDELPDGELQELPDGPVRIVAGVDFHDATKIEERPDEQRLGIGTVRPGTPWTDLRRLGAETLLIVAAGRAEALWLHTVARQLADAGIAVIGVVVVHPDPRDRSDGTLWDALNTAVRGRLAAGPAHYAVNGHHPVDGLLNHGTRGGTSSDVAHAIPVLAGVSSATVRLPAPTPSGMPANGTATDVTRALPLLRPPVAPMQPAPGPAAATPSPPLTPRAPAPARPLQPGPVTTPGTTEPEGPAAPEPAVARESPDAPAAIAQPAADNAPTPAASPPIASKGPAPSPTEPAPEVAAATSPKEGAEAAPTPADPPPTPPRAGREPTAVGSAGADAPAQPASPSGEPAQTPATSSTRPVGTPARPRPRPRLRPVASNPPSTAQNEGKDRP